MGIDGLRLSRVRGCRMPWLLRMRAVLVVVVLCGPVQAKAIPPLTCDTDTGGAHWGLDLLGPVAIWREASARTLINGLQLAETPEQTAAWMARFEHDGQRYEAIVTEEACETSLGGIFPLRLILRAATHQSTLRTGCCTVAE